MGFVGILLLPGVAAVVSLAAVLLLLLLGLLAVGMVALGLFVLLFLLLAMLIFRHQSRRTKQEQTPRLPEEISSSSDGR
jgi:membrane protein implicated in regulation of membrane protease activity